MNTPGRWWLFSANEFVARLGENPPPIRTTHGHEIYQKGYLYSTKTGEWYRCDITPVLSADVPKELRLRVLILS